nr:MAG: hypothetical protein [Totiviridae sp.]
MATRMLRSRRGGRTCSKHPPTRQRKRPQAFRHRTSATRRLVQAARLDWRRPIEPAHGCGAERRGQTGCVCGSGKDHAARKGQVAGQHLLQPGGTRLRLRPGIPCLRLHGRLDVRTYAACLSRAPVPRQHDVVAGRLDDAGAGRKDRRPRGQGDQAMSSRPPGQT